MSKNARGVNFLLDIHCHILPGVDDGAENEAASLEMAREAVREGITKIIATPHHKNERYDNHKEDILLKVKKLNDSLQREEIPLTILPGQETRIYGEILEDIEKDEILPLNEGKYLFIELPSSHVPRYTEKLLFDIHVKGFTPIIVHPERNAEIIENPNLLHNFVKKGTLTQVTAGSITGHFGKKIQKFSKSLIEANLTHFIASDAHNTTTRSFRLQKSLHVIEREFSHDLLYFFRENTELLLEGKTVYGDEPREVKKKRFLGIF